MCIYIWWERFMGKHGLTQSLEMIYFGQGKISLINKAFKGPFI